LGGKNLRKEWGKGKRNSFFKAKGIYYSKMQYFSPATFQTVSIGFLEWCFQWKSVLIVVVLDSLPRQFVKPTVSTHKKKKMSFLQIKG